MMAAFAMMWSDADKALIDAEIRQLGAQSPEVYRVLAYVAQIAMDGPRTMNQNIHSTVNGMQLHSVCPFGQIGAYYAYASAPIMELYLLGCFVNHYQHYGTAAARLAHVP
jgi:hypothetical protein